MTPDELKRLFPKASAAMFPDKEALVCFENLDA